MQYGWSTDEERYDGKFNSRGAAMEAAVSSEWDNLYWDPDDGDEPKSMTVWVCEIEEIDLGRYVPDVDFIIEQMEESLGEEVGEVAENFAPSKEEAGRFLGAIEKAARDHLKPNCWQATKTTCHQVDKNGKEVK